MKSRETLKILFPQQIAENCCLMIVAGLFAHVHRPFARRRVGLVGGNADGNGRAARQRFRPPLHFRSAARRLLEVRVQTRRAGAEEVRYFNVILKITSFLYKSCKNYIIITYFEK